MAMHNGNAARWKDPAVVLGLCFVPLNFFAAFALLRGDREAVYTVARVLRLLGFELFASGASLLYLRWRRFPMDVFRLRLTWQSLGVGFFTSLVLYILTGVVYRIAFLVLPAGGVVSFRMAAPAALFLAFLIFNSWFEETFLLAFPSAAFDGWSAATMILVTSALRASYHIYQGLAGAVAIFAAGVLLASVYRRTRDLTIPVVAHTVMNVISFALRVQS